MQFIYSSYTIHIRFNSYTIHIQFTYKAYAIVCVFMCMLLLVKSMQSNFIYLYNTVDWIRNPNLLFA